MERRILHQVGYETAFEDLRHVYLEDSWVLEVLPSTRAVAFRIDAVLTPEHPNYGSPRAGDQYCYRSGWLELASPDPIAFDLSGVPPARGDDQISDHGNIDCLAPDEVAGAWVVEGDWGRALVHSPIVTLRFDPI